MYNSDCQAEKPMGIYAPIMVISLAIMVSDIQT